MLVAAPERWDETCFAVPAVRALRQSGLATGVLCPEDQCEFWETLAGVEIMGFPPKAKPKAVATMLDDGWKASLAWSGGAAAAAFAQVGISRRLGPDEKALRKLLTHPLEIRPGPLEHRVRFYLGTVEALGIEALAPSFFAPADLGIETQAGTVMICPESDFGPSHEWPVDRWETVAAALRADGLRLTVAGLSGGRGMARRLADSLAGVEYFDANPIAGALPLLAVHQLLVAADGSLPHLAAYAGSTCVTLFGPNDASWKRPLGRRHAVVRRHVECSPCLLAKCPLDLRCQRELEADKVLAAVRAALA